MLPIQSSKKMIATLLNNLVMFLQGFGCFAGNYHINVDLSIKPVQSFSQRVSPALAKLEDL